MAWRSLATSLRISPASIRRHAAHVLAPGGSARGALVVRRGYSASRSTLGTKLLELERRGTDGLSNPPNETQLPDPAEQKLPEETKIPKALERTCQAKWRKELISPESLLARSEGATALSTSADRQRDIDSFARALTKTVIGPTGPDRDRCSELVHETVPFSPSAVPFYAIRQSPHTPTPRLRFTDIRTHC